MDRIKRLIVRREFKIGIIGIVSLMIIIFGINYLKGVNMLRPTNYFFVRFDNIMRLAKSSTVYADGFRIGIVHNITYDYDHPGNVLVEVHLDKDMRIPKGSHGELTTEMLGGVNMNMVLAHNTRDYYTQGDTIVGHAQTGLTDAIENDMMPQVINLMPKLDSILTKIDLLLANPNINLTLEQMRVTGENLAATSANLKQFTANDLPQLTATLNNTATGINALAGKFAALDIETTISQANQTIASVQNTVQKLERSDNTMGLLLNDTTLYRNLNQVAGDASLLMQDLKTNPKRYVHFSVFGKK